MEKLGSRFLLEGFLRNLILEGFSKICGENQVPLKSDKNNGHITWRPMDIYHNILPNYSQNEKYFR
jgi:hypothetical protein